MKNDSVSSADSNYRPLWMQTLSKRMCLFIKRHLHAVFERCCFKCLSSNPWGWRSSCRPTSLTSLQNLFFFFFEGVRRNFLFLGEPWLSASGSSSPSLTLMSTLFPPALIRAAAAAELLKYLASFLCLKTTEGPNKHLQIVQSHRTRAEDLPALNGLFTPFTLEVLQGLFTVPRTKYISTVGISFWNVFSSTRNYVPVTAGTTSTVATIKGRYSTMTFIMSRG